MAEGQKISERELIAALIGNEKIPLGVPGNKAATPALIRAYLLLTGIDTAALRNEAIAALETQLLGGVAEAGNNLKKLYDLIAGLEISKEDAGTAAAAIIALLDGVDAPGDTLKKLYDLIVALQSSKLDASAYNQHFKGKFLTEAAMNAAYIPSQLQTGDYAQVNEVGSAQVRNFSWDDEDEVWVEGGSGGSGASDTDALPEGATNLYFTSARVLATVITGFVAGAGVVADTDTVLQAINKIVGNVAAKQDALGLTTVGGNLVSLSNPSAVVFIRINADNSVSVRTAAELLADLYSGRTSDSTPLDTDEVFGYDTISGFQLRTTWANVKTFLKTYNDSLYAPVAASPIGSQDLYIPATAMWPRTTNGCAAIAKREVSTSLLNIQYLGFAAGVDRYAQFTISLPRNFNNGTITVKFYWTGASGSGDVTWGLAAGAYSDNDLLTTALGTAQEVTDTFLGADRSHITSLTSAITIAGNPADADFLGLSLYRKGSTDTFTQEAQLVGIVITITTDAATV